MSYFRPRRLPFIFWNYPKKFLGHLEKWPRKIPKKCPRKIPKMTYKNTKKIAWEKDLNIA